ncbi:hypothetical protein JRQ81_008831 [Phrynocephalus forsythii]|uniref:Exonuclease 1 n=1 Tax=Phrynocephalus forsythii TaxID=171643 RepID=A0A9Q0Y5I0_9SAUR|nr:hypothetical protein JRQ81_008831 [Phrynocephalus forsythii]
MGIQGLLQFIKEAAEPAHVKKYKGQAVAVDTYCWLHKGAYACAEKLAKGEPTDQYVAYCMKLVNMLLSFGVKPILVFDGCTLPSKREVEKARREKRQANLLKGKQLLREGKLSEAKECFARSINVTHAMACEVIKAARTQGVDCIVAPYEADAQLAYLNKTGMVQAVITEDSDLLAFGCKKVFLKIDKSGNGLEIDQARLGTCKQLGDVFTEEKFRYMCILSGCDYLPSIYGIGLAKACKLLKIANNPDIIKVIGKMGQYLKMNIVVPDDYIQGFIRANNTFLYQLVFDPVRRKLVPLNAYEDGIDPETLLYAGKHIGDGTAFQIALGNKDISTMEEIDNYSPDAQQPVQPRSRGWDDKHAGEKPSGLKSIWSRNYKPGSPVKPTTKPAPLEKPTTRGIERQISTKGLKLPSKAFLAKRPRHEEISEGDLLSQYFSNSKKTKTEHEEEGERREAVAGASLRVLASGDSDGSKECSAPPPRLRNKFAFVRQRKNEESGTIVVPGTRSRFFCSIMDLPDRLPKDDIAQPSQDSRECGQAGETERRETEDCNPGSTETREGERTFSPSFGAAQTSCFSWSRSFAEWPRTSSPASAIALVKQFQRRTPSKVTYQDCSPSGSKTDNSILGKELEEESSPSKESGSLSEHTLDERSLNTSEESLVTQNNIDDRVPGLRKTISVQSPAVTRCKSLVPARVSGLSKKIAQAKKKNHHDAENKVSLKGTINDLWRSFQFKRESEKLPSSKKTKPLSPIKDNNIQLTPETDDDAFSKPGFGDVQRKIFQ